MRLRDDQSPDPDRTGRLIDVTRLIGEGRQGLGIAWSAKPLWQCAGDAYTDRARPRPLAISEGGGSHGRRCLQPVLAHPYCFLGCNRLISLDISAHDAPTQIRAIAADGR